MKLSVWLRYWYGLWCKIFVSRPKGIKPRKAKKYRLARIEKERHPKMPWKIEKKRTRRSHNTMNDIRTERALFSFVVLAITIVIFPVFLALWGYNSVKSPRNKKAQGSTLSSKKQLTYHSTQQINEHIKEEKEEFFAPKNDVSEVKDENAPKSKPRNENDQYIRKRMIIAGSHYCSSDALSKLSVGAHLELVSEPSNEYDSNAIMLIHENEKIGYVAKSDLPPFTACMRLGRAVYGIITDIITKDGITKYEYEAWFVK